MLCDKPDRDVPKLKCGYPLPCPHHTVVVDLTGKKPKIEGPVAVGVRGFRRIAEVAKAVKGKR